MAMFLRTITVICLLIGGAANAYVWSITNGRVSAWDFSMWPVLFHNILLHPTSTISMIMGGAIVPTLLGIAGVVVWIIAALAGKTARSINTPSAPNGKSDGQSPAIQFGTLREAPKSVISRTSSNRS